jgi:lysophospholipase L1-like esterase
MVIIKKINQTKAFKKNYLGYFFIFLFCLVATSSISCASFAKKAVNVSQGIPFNYPGLRLETRSIKLQDLEYCDPLIFCFGDSVTFGWNLDYSRSYPAQLEILLKEKYKGIKVVNSGAGGNTVYDGIKRIKRDVISYNPDTVIINFGLNDGMLHKSASKAIPDGDLYYSDGKNLFVPAIEINDFEEKYSGMLKMLDAENINVIVLGITPVTEDFNPGNNTEMAKKQKEIYYVYNKRLMDMAIGKDIDYIDIWKIFTEYKEGISVLIQKDGIHPGSKGQKLIAESLFEHFMQF